MHVKLKRTDMIFGAAAFASFLVSFLLIKFSGFSSSSIINIQSYFLRAILTQTTGTGTLDAIGLVFQPFLLLFVAIIFYVLGLSVLAAHGYYSDDIAGKFTGIPSAIAALVLFQSMWGAFLAASVLVSCIFSGSLANAYKKELKRWVTFRVGSHTIGKMFLLLAIFMSVGIFAVVMSQQASYSSLFKKELVDITKSIALSVPGAEIIPEDILNSQIEQLVQASPIFESYVRWMPVMTALAVWFTLQFLALFATLLGGAFTYAIIKAFRLEE